MEAGALPTGHHCEGDYAGARSLEQGSQCHVVGVTVAMKVGNPSQKLPIGGFFLLVPGHRVHQWLTFAAIVPLMKVLPWKEPLGHRLLRGPSTSHFGHLATTTTLPPPPCNPPTNVVTFPPPWGGGGAGVG